MTLDCRDYQNRTVDPGVRSRCIFFGCYRWRTGLEAFECPPVVPPAEVLADRVSLERWLDA